MTDTPTVNSPDMVSVEEFERQVLAVDGVTIVIRAPSKSLVKPFAFTRRSRNTCIKTWVDNRIWPSIEHIKGIGFVIVYEGLKVSHGVFLNRIRQDQKGTHDRRHCNHH